MHTHNPSELDVGQPVSLHGPVSPPEATPAENVQEEARSDNVAENAAGERTGVMRGGVDPAELGRLSGVARRAATETPRTVLEAVLYEQVRIATGKAKGTAPATRTSAAKAVGELQGRLDAMPMAHAQVDWSRLGATRREVMRRLIEGDETHAERLLEESRRLQGEENARG